MRESRGQRGWAIWRRAILLALGGLLLSCLGLPEAPPGPASSAPLTSELPAVSRTQPPSTAASTPALSALAAPPSAAMTAVPGRTVLTGWSQDSGYDEDGNGLFEFLKVAVELTVVQAGGYGFTTALVGPQGQFVAVGALTVDYQRAAPVTSADLSPGRQVVPIYFDGRAICASGIDGPYTVRVGLSDNGNMAGAADFITQAYRHLDFQGPLFELLGISDSGVKTNTDLGYSVLRTVIHVNIVAATEVQAEGQLFAGSTLVADAAATVSLPAGAQTVNLDFPGNDIAASGLDGPYTVYLYLKAGLDATAPAYTTGAYKHTDYHLPVAGFTGSIMDSGIDGENQSSRHIAQQ